MSRSFTNLTVLLGLALTAFVAPSTGLAAGCREVFRSRSDSSQPANQAMRATLEAQIARLSTSGEAFIEFIVDRAVEAGLSPSRQEAREAAMYWFMYLGEAERQHVARILVLNHRFEAQGAVSRALDSYMYRGHLRNNNPSRRELIDQLTNRTTVDVDVFARLFKRGLNISDDANFTASLRTAVTDFLVLNERLEPQDTNNQKIERSVQNLISGLRNLKDPSLVGQWLEHFESGDQLVRLYILARNVELSASPGTEGLLQLRTEGRPSFDMNWKRGFLLTMNEALSTVEERAYFGHQARYGLYHSRPAITDLEAARIIALRALRTSVAHLNDFDQAHALETLVKYPKADAEIDAMLTEKIDRAATALAAGRTHYTVISRYARFELAILMRAAQQKTVAKEDRLRFSTRLLNSDATFLAYLRSLLELSETTDIRQFPTLRARAAKYLQRHPQELPRLMGLTTQRRVNRFAQALGL